MNLCLNGKTEEVREAFRELLSPDGGDIVRRQMRISEFVGRMNELLQELSPNEWFYREKIRTGIRFLAVLDPTHNYFFKASECVKFAGYIEEDNEIGFDRHLKLANYYQMCDNIAAYLKNDRPDTMALLSRALTEKERQTGLKGMQKVDPNCHILVCDLMHAAFQYDFYADKSANRKSKISAVAKRKIDRQKQSADLIEEREACVNMLDDIMSREAKTRIPELKGTHVDHKAFGEGCVKEQDGKYLTVEFKEVSKKFALPGAIINGFLQFDNSGDYQVFQDLEKIQAEKRQIEDKLMSIDAQLKFLE